MKKTRTRKEWEKHLSKEEITALKDFGFTENEMITPEEVIQTIAAWNAMVSVHYTKDLIRRIYGIEL